MGERQPSRHPARPGGLAACRAGRPAPGGATPPAPGELVSSGEVGDPDQPIPAEGVPNATVDQGAQPLAFMLDGDTKVFELTAQPVCWKILPDVTVTAWSYNGMVPGPLIRVTEGDKLRIILHNRLPVPTTIHRHGIILPNGMDGVPDMTQPPVQPGQDFTYEFQVRQNGTYWYHSHFHSDVQLPVGLYGPLIIDPREPPGPPPGCRAGDYAVRVALAGRRHLPGDADGRDGPHLFHHQRQGLPPHPGDSAEDGPAVAAALHQCGPVHTPGATCTGRRSRSSPPTATRCRRRPN